MALNELLYGVFWEPDLDLMRFIVSCKNKVRKVEPRAAYLDHPPHCTLYLVSVQIDRIAELENILQEFATKCESIVISISGWHTFQDDKLTGGDTLVMALNNSRELIALQRGIADSLSPLKAKNIDYGVNWEGAFWKSWEKYGFPFVGEHWLPHLTIASIREDGKNLIEKAKLELNYHKSYEINSISLFRIIGDEHQRIKKFDLI